MKKYCRKRSADLKTNQRGPQQRLAFVAREVLHMFCLACGCNLMFTLLGT
jgi:hypothetical protein